MVNEVMLLGDNMIKYVVVRQDVNSFDRLSIYSSTDLIISVLYIQYTVQ
jgi:hypothetical protein